MFDTVSLTINHFETLAVFHNPFPFYYGTSQQSCEMQMCIALTNIETVQSVRVYVHACVRLRVHACIYIHVYISQNFKSFRRRVFLITDIITKKCRI